jgi:hypothetical protein
VTFLKPARRLLAACASALVLATAALHAEETAIVQQEGAAFSFSAAGHRIVMPLPDWLSAAERLSADVLGKVEHNTYADGQQAFVEFFPSGQSIDNWTTTYAARITNDSTRSLSDYRAATIVGYSKPCKPEATGVFQFGEETPDFFPALAFVCGAYLDTIATLKGQGEVMVSVFRKTGTGVAVVYQEWKGPAFDPSNPATWPVSRADLEARAKQLQDDTELFDRAGV